ncbi:MAG TPA: GxxExxY protein [Phycisphaerales bacterium]|mgnify:CR=1 FL=1|nr:GxxExxY protein [Phycisphaerales bacterium]HCD32499.1 GxxExxY protein [Phycisphaerales bacterium]|tara:strand:- start:234 stop:620 length:387 start_codon:yes stop_codon:yes gene_type:complete
MIEPGDQLNELSGAVIGAAIAVHKELGPGFQEQTYSRALSVELEAQNIKHVREAPVSLFYRGQAIGDGRLDFLVEDKLVIELKAIEKLHAVHHSQVLSYLKATKLPLGLLINFNVNILKDGIQRVVLS